MAFNATGSADAFYTASTVFKYAYRYDNFVYAADFDFRSRKDSAQARQIYRSLDLAGQPLFGNDEALIEKFLSMPFVSVPSATVAAGRPLERITDRNMLTEFKYGAPLR